MESDSSYNSIPLSDEVIIAVGSILITFLFILIVGMICVYCMKSGKCGLCKKCNLCAKPIRDSRQGLTKARSETNVSDGSDKNEQVPQQAKIPSMNNFNNSYNNGAVTSSVRNRGQSAMTQRMTSNRYQSMGQNGYGEIQPFATTRSQHHFSTNPHQIPTGPDNMIVNLHSVEEMNPTNRNRGSASITTTTQTRVISHEPGDSNSNNKHYNPAIPTTDGIRIYTMSNISILAH